MTEQEASALVDGIRNRFSGEVEAEEVAPGRFRFTVASTQFAGVTPLRRQDLLWEVVDQTLSREAILDVSLIIAYSPDELEEMPATQIVRFHS